MQSNITSPIRTTTTFEIIMNVLYRPALMAPPASRIDCFRCPHVENDSDGVAESCDLPIGEPCIRNDRRSPWGVR